VEDEINALVDALNKSEYTKEESNLILNQYINAVIRNGVQDVMRYPIAMTTMDFTKRVKAHEWKFARGFFGNWAKHAIEEKDQDVGC
jgi:hypothetical protein